MNKVLSGIWFLIKCAVCLALVYYALLFWMLILGAGAVR